MLKGVHLAGKTWKFQSVVPIQSTRLVTFIYARCTRSCVGFILSGIYSILSGKLSGMYYDILSSILSRIYSDFFWHLFQALVLAFYLASIRHLFWQKFWHSIWYLHAREFKTCWKARPGWNVLICGMLATYTRKQRSIAQKIIQKASPHLDTKCCAK